LVSLVSIRISRKITMQMKKIVAAFFIIVNKECKQIADGGIILHTLGDNQKSINEQPLRIKEGKQDYKSKVATASKSDPSNDDLHRGLLVHHRGHHHHHQKRKKMR